MKVVTYDEIDPMEALNVSLLALDFPFTHEYALHVRKTDPRAFPCLAVYAVDGDKAVGQVGIFRLPMISIDGREDVGGVWAVATHPEYAGRGVASILLDEAHERMRAAGLRFSTLGTSRYRVANKVYHRHGYQDMQVWATALTRWEKAHQPTRLRAEVLGSGGYDYVEELFENIGKAYLGFSWRYRPFASVREEVALENIWILWNGSQPVGYALARVDRGILKISDMLLQMGMDAVEAVAALTACFKTAYVQVTISRPVDMNSLRMAGYQVAHPNWSAFMVKPLLPEVSADDARRLFGIGTDRFLISWLDTT
jgi:GNAT superfamily N-acetyltransferase